MDISGRPQDIVPTAVNESNKFILSDKGVVPDACSAPCSSNNRYRSLKELPAEE